MVKRRFASIDIGQVHYWTAGEEHRGSAKPPLVLLHASPFSGRSLNALTEPMGQSRWAIAPDHLGQGDSCAPTLAEPPVEYFSDKMIAFFDALGIAAADLYGTHTGAHVAIDIAIRHPKRVRRLILDGVGLPNETLKNEYVAHLRERPPFDYTGAQMMWAFQTAQDLYLFFPYYDRDTVHRRKRDMGSPSDLHRRALELLRNLRTYHQAYIAAFEANPGGRKYPLIPQPVLYTVAAMDGSAAAFDQVAKMIANCTARRYPEGAIAGDYGAAAPMFRDWLDS
ncbi:MAG: hypothetical protein FJX65_12920 [Alphaproteobacteria bacterium]|nr:hypothetical protein [Alphaproteobacteria bacterium]